MMKSTNKMWVWGQKPHLGGIRITGDSQQGIGVLGTARQFRDTVCENSQTQVPSTDGRTRNLKLKGGNAPLQFGR
ncbi:MAG: hypothetical protein MSIBF_01665 [Candidatus Altiarchaeales archaeon IMC4]|nr:MAG: hypothetical protein MSIBF_01665 [Candidatus Altiarchaeales archaeon IMC4]